MKILVTGANGMLAKEVKEKFAKENEANISDSIRVLHLWDTDSGMIDKWHKYCQKQMWDQYKLLDDNLIFSIILPSS